MDMSKTGKFIASLRRERGLTQEQLGDIVGATNKTVSRWETGSYMPPIDALEIIAREFGVTVNDLVAGERIAPEKFEEKAEANLKTALENSAFTLKEREKYFSERWERAHLPLRIVLAAAWLAALAAGLWFKNSYAVLGASLLGFAAAVVLYNMKRAYVEQKAFGQASANEKNNKNQFKNE